MRAISTDVVGYSMIGVLDVLGVISKGMQGYHMIGMS